MNLYQITGPSFCLLLFGLSWAFTGMYRRFALNRGYVDSPNVRSSHATVKPRGGGIVFSLMWFALLGFAYYAQWVQLVYLYVFYPALLVALIGFKDDMKSVSPKVRLLVQTVACGLSLYFIQVPVESFWGFTVPAVAGIELHSYLFWGAIGLCVLWMTNLMNFMDGTDGLCATQAVFVLGFASYMFYQSGAYGLCVLCVGACSVVLGFLTWNWPAANIFMGDCGSGFLGFLIAIMALASHKWFHISYAIWLILTVPFWFDATITLLRRILKGEKWTQAHCLHAYQRLTHVGWRHSTVLLGLILINCATVSMAWVGFHHPKFLQMMLLMSIALVGLVYLLVEVYKPMYTKWHV